MSTTILAVVINLLATILPQIGIEIGSEALTTTASTLLTIGTGLWIWYQRVKRGDVSVVGKRI